MNTYEHTPSSAFENLYPDVEPTQGLPLTPIERGCMAIACATTIFGVISEQYVIALIGFALTLFSTITPTRKTARRIRMEARDRFPEMEWAEDQNEEKTRVLFPAFWIIIAGSAIALSTISTTSGNTTVAMVAAIITAILVWFLPGTSRIWNR